MSQRSIVALAGAIAVATIVVAVLLVRAPPPGMPSPPEVPGASPRPPPRLDARMNVPTPETPVPPAATPPTAPPSLDTPRATVAAQLALIDAGNAHFAETLMPGLRAQVTAETLASCKAYVGAHPVRPDWEAAEESTGADGRVVRVSMFGKSETGFHELGGKWLADAVWCLPPTLP